MEKEEHGRELSSAELRKIQLDILTAIDEYCSLNHIRYSLAYGSLLGAVRHKGYIPWDDDIDIFVPRDDYERLMESFPEGYKGHYNIASLSRDPMYLYPFAKAYDNDTVLIEHVRDKKNIGVNIDIFPIDNVPDVEQEWKKYDKKRRFNNSIFRLRFVRLKKSRSIWKNLVLIIINMLTFPITQRKWSERKNKNAQKYKMQPGKYCYDNCNGVYKIPRYKREWFEQFIRIPFEDREFMAIADYDECLTTTYGDYMTPPPVDKRQTKHSFNAYFKNNDRND